MFYILRFKCQHNFTTTTSTLSTTTTFLFVRAFMINNYGFNCETSTNIISLAGHKILKWIDIGLIFDCAKYCLDSVKN